MAETKDKNLKADFSLMPEGAKAHEDVASARILFQEGLIDEAKQVLRKLLIREPDSKFAQELFEQIREHELKEPIRKSIVDKNLNGDPHDVSKVISDLERDLELQLETEPHHDEPIWSRVDANTPESHFDLAVGYFEMGCFQDAILEAERALQLKRQTHSHFDELSISIVNLKAESLIEISEAYRAKTTLEELVNDLHVSHEQKLMSFYLMGRAEEALNKLLPAKGWYQKVAEEDPDFKDVSYRLGLL